ncbi:orotate phosphoribosyltransferase [Desulfofundulus thermocisternus]|uniref:orotate phosphoribosyltransferase n=1 Tax=Desulfofundulus thermocisternus TaxID=42471 RepID=UPI0019F3E07F|nr:orotate phosphoribosyltransferase [Desulfofundulus thermocisternus]MBE3585145.1 orotate phosphoribosyltransferase [Thermoanaerobacter sp.]MCS5695989.1 orotate phosphoribosyltransferase [Desulfofundulus thermocisternus]
MLNHEEILSIFKKTGAMLTGHFVLTSGRHSDRYFQCARVLEYPRYCELLCRELVRKWGDGELAGVETVIGPALGGILVSYEVARVLGARSLFTERENGIMTLRRGFTLSPGERVLVVEDVITTGGSVREVIAVAREAGAQVAGVAVLVDRSNGNANLDVPLRALLTIPVVTYGPEECPLCREGIPAVKPGSRHLSGAGGTPKG